jgi:hypothetical protein
MCARDLDPLLCDISRDHESVICRILWDQNGIALDQLIKLWSHAVRPTETIYQQIVYG